MVTYMNLCVSLQWPLRQLSRILVLRLNWLWRL